jgi:hypothetical protein
MRLPCLENPLTIKRLMKYFIDSYSSSGFVLAKISF